MASGALIGARADAGATEPVVKNAIQQAAQTASLRIEDFDEGLLKRFWQLREQTEVVLERWTSKRMHTVGRERIPSKCW